MMIKHVKFLPLAYIIGASYVSVLHPFVARVNADFSEEMLVEAAKGSLLGLFLRVCLKEHIRLQDQVYNET